MMRDRVTRGRAVALAGLLALLTACGGTESAGPSSAPGGTACVADPAAVVARQLPAAAEQALPESTAQQLDAAARQGFADAASPGAVVAVRGPAGSWTQSYGVADPAAGTAMSDALYQRIGSVTKTFTGTVLLQLEQEGLVRLDDPIARYVPAVPNGEAITLRMLLTMTSGIASYTLDEDFTAALFQEPNRNWTPQQLLDIGLALPPLFAPGEQFNYSNTNFILLGIVAEQLTGHPFAQLVQERVTEPLRLTHTSLPAGDDTFPAPHAQGFTLQGTPDGSTTPVNTTAWNPTWAWTAGEMLSTTENLLRYGRALGTGQGLLAAEQQIARLTSFPDTGGYGLAVGCIDGWVGHTGELPGYNTSVFYDTSTDITVVVLANSDIPSGACTASKTLPDTPAGLPCMDPATRVFAAVSSALGHTFTPVPKQ